MGAATEKHSDPAECEALLAPEQQVFGAKQDACAPPSEVSGRSWDGNLLQCCGQRCTAQGWGSCAISYFLPCFAFGNNMKRALRQSFWVHGLLYLVLFYGVHRCFSLAVVATSDHCQVDLPVTPELKPHQPGFEFAATAHDSWLSGRKLLQQNIEPGQKFKQAFSDVMPTTEAAAAVVYGGSEEQSSTNAEEHPEPKHAHQGHKGHHGKGKGKCPKGPEAEPKSDCHDHEDKHKPPVPHPVVIPFTAEFDLASPGCQKAYVGLSVLYILTVLAAITGIIHAARQRTLMRKALNIPGSRCGDILAWLCCASCALCQETRTLHANNVREGIWQNPIQPGQVVHAAAWTAPEPMKPPKSELLDV